MQVESQRTPRASLPQCPAQHCSPSRQAENSCWPAQQRQSRWLFLSWFFTSAPPHVQAGQDTSQSRCGSDCCLSTDPPRGSVAHPEGTSVTLTMATDSHPTGVLHRADTSECGANLRWLHQQVRQEVLSSSSPHKAVWVVEQLVSRCRRHSEAPMEGHL